MSATPRVYLAKKSTILKIRLVTKTTCTNKTNEEEKLVLLPENEIEEISRENQTIHELVENLLDQVEIRTNLRKSNLFFDEQRKFAGFVFRSIRKLSKSSVESPL